jgi:phosphatidylglycerol:prolipoprotein diacylglycerol transferase
MLPILYQNHDLILYSYPLLMGLGWGVAYQVYFSLLDPGFSRVKAQFLFWGIFFSAWIGAKVFFFLTYPENVSSDFLKQISFWTGGGFVFYGGFIGATLFLGTTKLFDKRLSIDNLWAMLPAVAFGHAIGRIGCFLAGCCFGKPTSFLWGVYLHDHYRHPTQLIEAFGLALLGLYLYKSKMNRLVLLANYLVGYGLLRLVVESLRGDLVRGLWGPLTPSQWISLALIFSGLVIMFLKKFNQLARSKQSSQVLK